MKPHPHLPLPVAISGLALLGALLLGWSISTYGPGMGQTGLHNIAAAESLVSGESLVTSRDEPFTLWPPLMPLLFTAGTKLGLHYSATAGVLNVLAYFTLLLCTGLLAWQLSRSRVAVVVSQLIVLAAPPIFRAVSNATTEPLFIALSLVGIVSTVHHARTGERRWLVLAATALSLAALQRYVGVVLIGATAVSLLFSADRTLGFSRRSGRAALFAFVALLPTGLWALHNLTRVGQLSGMRVEADTGYGQNTLRAIQNFATWAAPQRWPLAPRIVLCTTLLLAVFLGLRQLLAHTRPRLLRWSVTHVLWLTVAYTLFLIVYGSNTRIDPLAHRLLLPTLPLLAVLTAVALRACLGRGDAFARNVGTLGLASLFLTIAAGTLPTRQVAARNHSEGSGGLGAKEWRESPLVEALLACPLEGPVYSNLPELVGYYRGVHASFLDPKRLKHALRESELMHTPGTIVWVSRNGHPKMRAKGPPRIELQVQLVDGAIYTTTPPPAAPPQSEPR